VLCLNPRITAHYGGGLPSQMLGIGLELGLGIGIGLGTFADLCDGGHLRLQTGTCNTVGLFFKLFTYANV